MTNEEFDFTDATMLRKKAEEKLRQKSSNGNGLEMESDMKKLIHELQVHQIELEMQNEELVQAYETAEASLKKYTLLYDLAPVGFFILDHEGTICDLNFTAAELLGDKRFSLLESNFKLFVAQDSRQEFSHFFSQIYAGTAKMTCELNLAYDGNPLGAVYMEGVVTEGDRKCLLSVIDLGPLRK